MENHNYEKLPVTKQEIINESMTNETLMTSSDKSSDDIICELVPVKEEPKRPTKVKCRKSYTLKEKLECLGWFTFVIYCWI